MTALSLSQPGAGPFLRTWLAFAALCVGMFMAILDVQIVAASLPAMQAALAIGPEQMSWVQTSYLIAEVVAIPLTGLLTRALTMRWLSVADPRRLHDRVHGLRVERLLREPARLARGAGVGRRASHTCRVRGWLRAVSRTAARRWPSPSPACSPCLPPRSVHSSAAGSPTPTAGPGCFSSTSPPASQRSRPARACFPRRSPSPACSASSIRSRLL